MAGAFVPSTALAAPFVGPVLNRGFDRGFDRCPVGPVIAITAAEPVPAVLSASTDPQVVGAYGAPSWSTLRSGLL